ncbi:amino acid adenylation domain-containing protein [Streptomyces sp. NPDC057445]|uniref:non-ribosomal peptide synthetase n=1 Tax=Streptomyces sp. NPDC057445 TaxID=3346136 RepID=UPI00368A3789
MSSVQDTGITELTERAVDLPVTASQRSLLFIQEAMERKDLYNISFRITFEGEADPDALRRALRRLLDVQPTLRTEFTLDGGETRARITRPAGVPLDVSTSRATGPDWERLVDEESKHFATLPVDLRQAPLCRFKLLLAPGRSALLCNIHHSVSDGVSMRAFLDELCAGYRLATGSPAGTAEPDPAERERHLSGELAAQVRATDAAIEAGEVKKLAAELAGVPATTLYQTPTRPVNTSFAGADLNLLLDAEERHLVERTARELSTTPFCVLLACYAALLGEYAGQEQVVVGSPFSTRRTIASHDLCGFFVNTLPLVLPARDVPFDTHCAAVTDVVREAKRYQAIPFDALVAQASPERTTNRNPLFQCMFAMQDELRTRIDLDEGLHGKVEFVSQQAARFDLWLGATPVEEGLLIEVEYDKDLLPASYAERFLGEYRQLLLRAARSPRTSLTELVAGLDTRTVPEFRRSDEARTDADGGLVGLVLDAARRHPEKLAVTDPHGTGLTYRELVDRTARAAAGLHGRGVRRGHVVAVVPDTLADTVVSMLAILWCGATYLPVDTTLPADRLSYMISHSGCTLVIGSRSVVPGEPERTTVTALQEAGGAAQAAPSLPDGTAPVYIMFTSGSTGRPKGVLMGQPALVNLLHWQTDELRMGPDTRFLQFAPLGFDVSYQEIFPTLAAGGTVHGLGAVDRRDLAQVATLVEDQHLTHVYLPVAVLGAFADAVHEGGHSLEAVGHICVSGEQLHLDSRSRRLLDAHDRLTLVNLYGPTETHAVTYHVLPGGPLERPSHVPIGGTLPGVDTYLLDRHGRQVPPGAVGELYFGGVCPADGYVNDPERTGAAFLPAPSGTGRVYRTGDLAMLAEDGALVFLGRRDSQVKLRGHRIELGELETASEKLTNVKAAAAAIHGTGEQAALCLFVLPAPGAVVDTRELRDALQQELPAYMIPRHVLAIDTMPLTDNGKIDRKNLVGRFAAGEFAGAEARGTAGTWAPTPTEALIREMWTQLLGNEPAGADESFFLLGGNSFDVLRLLRSVEERTGTRVPVVEFFRAPTIRALAGHVDAPGRSGGDNAHGGH